MEINQLGDQQLMQRIASGDVVAFEMVYDRYASSVMGLCFRVIGNREMAEEIVQETFWSLWRKADGYDAEKGSLATWLFRIARNSSIDLLRRHQARPEPVALEETHYQRPDEVDVAGLAWDAQQRQQIHQALTKLPPDQRQIIEMAYFQGKTRREIADECNVPLGTVHTRARLALQKLQKTLLASGFEN